VGVIIGVLVGYALGSRAGDDAWTELEDAWRTIVSSEEVQDLLTGGLAMARDVLGHRAEILADVLGVSDDARLRRAA
jgi:hypothetical protein